MSEKSSPLIFPLISGGISPFTRKLSKYFLMTESMPEGKDGNIPRGLFMWLFFSSQKHRGHWRKRLSADGDSLILLFLDVFVLGTRSSMKSQRVFCSALFIYYSLSVSFSSYFSNDNLPRMCISGMKALLSGYFAAKKDKNPSFTILKEWAKEHIMLPVRFVFDRKVLIFPSCRFERIISSSISLYALHHSCSMHLI